MLECCDSEETLKKQLNIHNSPTFCPCSVVYLVYLHTSIVYRYDWSDWSYADISIKKLAVIVTLLNKFPLSVTIFGPVFLVPFCLINLYGYENIVPGPKLSI